MEIFVRDRAKKTKKQLKITGTEWQKRTLRLTCSPLIKIGEFEASTLLVLSNNVKAVLEKKKYLSDFKIQEFEDFDIL